MSPSSPGPTPDPLRRMSPVATLKGGRLVADDGAAATDGDALPTAADPARAAADGFVGPADAAVALPPHAASDAAAANVIATRAHDGRPGCVAKWAMGASPQVGRGVSPPVLNSTSQH